MSKKLGKYGENIAKQHYINNGYKILIQNYYCRYGELDLVVQKGNKIKIIEVKTRQNNSFGWPEESINDLKLAKIIKSYQMLQNKLDLSNNYEIEAFILELGLKKKIYIIQL